MHNTYIMASRDSYKLIFPVGTGKATVQIRALCSLPDKNHTVVKCKIQILIKTGQMIVDFRKKSYPAPDPLIYDQAIEVVHQYKYI